jgi:hypothetical protein
LLDGRMGVRVRREGVKKKRRKKRKKKEER